MDNDQFMDIVRSKHLQNGVMKADKDICTQCGLCIKNCPFKCWEMGGDEFPRLKDEYDCFSCSNCVVACPVDAISIVETYKVTDGFWQTAPEPLAYTMPFDPLDADGNPDEFNPIERAILERRSVRNFKDKPVPEPLIRRVLEAGRAAPSAGNCQPWKFIVITDRKLIDQMNEATLAAISPIYSTYKDDAQVQNLKPATEANPSGFDRRMASGGMGSVAKRHLLASLGAPCAIVMLGDRRSIGSLEMNIGICGQNMNIVANSLGIKACWSGFLSVGFGAIAGKFDIGANWQPLTTLVLGYPAFKQEGMVPREYRPVQWFREGSDAVEID
jgi:nitroreductase/NAD-dependent dihydropyrimidine dehydrogenase PreA subunit